MSGAHLSIQQATEVFRELLLGSRDSNGRQGLQEANEADLGPESVRRTLAAMGAPLFGVSAERRLPLEVALLLGVELARHDGTVFRVLPLVLLRVENELDWSELKEAALKLDVARELGLLASLAAKLADRPSLAARVVDLKGTGAQSPRYFPEVRSSFERTLAEGRSPPVAREWGFHVNVSEESLRSTIAKHGG